MHDSSLCRSSRQFTPLHIAAQKGHAEIAELLIRADAALEAKDTCHVSADGRMNVHTCIIIVMKISQGASLCELY